MFTTFGWCLWGCIFPVWFPHCSDVPWDFSGGGVPFCPFLCPPFTLGDVCLCFPLPDCVLSGLEGFLGWCLLLLRPPTVVLLDVPDASLCLPGSSLSSFSLHHYPGGSDSCIVSSIGDIWFPLLMFGSLEVDRFCPFLSCFVAVFSCSVSVLSGFPSGFPDSSVGLSPIGMGCLPSF